MWNGTHHRGNTSSRSDRRRRAIGRDRLTIQRRRAPQVHPLPKCYLRRPWIVQRLSTDAPVTLVLGPAGIGKTVAVSGWATESDAPVAWVSVTPTDARGSTFWDAVEEALCAWMQVERALVAPDERLPLGDAVLRLVAILESSLEHDVVLVIDDYHIGEDEDLAASMELFLRRLPARLRVVIVSRHVPMLPLDRMRVAGDLREIDVDDLRFSDPDAGKLLEGLAPDADQQAVDTIVAAADGWVAGLRLGALAWSAQNPDAAATAGWLHNLDNFVMREVLGEASESLLRFLGDLAVVDQASIALAEAITEHRDADEVLESARDRGMFVSRVGVRGHYEIHSAVRRALLTEREQRDPLRLHRCRRRAAGWFEGHGDTVLALEQWLHAGDHGQALRLMAERHVQLYDTGQEESVRDLLAKLAPEATATNVSSLLDLAWCQLVTDLPAFRENVQYAAWWSEHGGHIDVDAARRLRALQAIVGLSQGDWRLAERDARAALDEHPSWYDDPIIRTTWNDVARSIALSERWDDTSDEVREVAVMVRRDPTRNLVLQATRALGAALAGRPIDALRAAAGVRTSAKLADLTMSSDELALAEVIARRELGDAPDAEAELARLINADVGPLTYVRGIAAAELTQLHLDRGSLLDATRAFCQLERAVTDEMSGPDGRAWLGRIGTVLSIEAGDQQQAQRWADGVDDPFWGPVSQARVLAVSDTENAHELLGAASARSPRQAVILAMLRATTTADRDAALTWTESAVRIASADNMLQTLASAGQLELIERISWRLPGDWMDRLRRATAIVQPAVNARVSLIEPLTVRERDVLRFLPSRLTLKEIAEELYISVNTLKFHLKVIYRKLGVNSRAEAAGIARSWGRVDHR